MSRKYKQSGYMSDDGGDRPARPSKPQPRPEREGPRGRGLGAPTATVFRCRACGGKVRSGEVALDSTCGSCGADLHCCSNCRHFDPGTRFECRQPIPERISSKTRRNRCELFAPRETQEFDRGRSGGGGDDPRSAFDALFDF
jgi:predicted RNA-binding Zn-ribbon protein involved in translation (DUF1610 family)